jgi:Putative MetA-pathway of phenol degradation
VWSQTLTLLANEDAMAIQWSGRIGARILTPASLFALGLAHISVAEAQTADAGAQLSAATLQATPDPYHELETKYLFGFTEGADIGAEGEKSIELETTTESGRRGGSYGTLEQEVEFEGVPSQYFGYELSAHGFGYSVDGVEGFANAHGANFSGLSAEFRYLVVGRGPDSPFGFTLVAEPEWARFDDGGQHVTDFNVTFRAIVDTELVANRLYAAANLIYNPDYARSANPWEQSSTYGITGALAYRVAPKITLGGEAEFYRAYDSFGFQSFQGQAFYLGPTLHIQFNGRVMLSAAWSTQVAGHASGEQFGLDLANFPQQRGNLKFEVEF